MPTRKILEKCPSCGSELYVSEMTCTNCDTVIRGRYSGCTFCQLSPEDSRFLEIFVACRGNVKEMERETGLGYWTIRGKLDDIIRELKMEERPAVPEEPKLRRRDILEAVERGELSVAEAEQMLAKLAKKTSSG